MIKNYLTVAIRNLLKNRTFSAINIFGLAIGMTCFILILLYVQDEMRYDRHHENAHQIYRLAEEVHSSVGVQKVALTSFPMGPALVKDYSEVFDAVRFFNWKEKTLVGTQQDHFYEKRVWFTDANVFAIFNFPLRQGDPKTALQEPHSVVITEEMAQKYFGEADPIGQVLAIDGEDFKITGILKDHIYNTHFQFDFLASLVTRGPQGWIDHSYYTYLLLQEDGSARELEAKLPNFIERHVSEHLKTSDFQFKPFLQPLTEIHLHSHLEYEMSANGDIRYVYLFLVIAFFVLLLACVNFMNLSTARSAKRSKEVGLRKVVGANRPQLIRQFLCESMLMALFALFIAVVLVEMTLPAFNAFVDRELVLDYFGNWAVLLALLGVMLFTGGLSGSYPALFLSAFQPVAALKGYLVVGSTKSGLRKTLVVFQFAISVILIIGTGVVYDQSDYIRNKRLGFHKDHVVVIPYTGKQVMDRYRSILSTYGNVLNASASSMVPGRRVSRERFRPVGATNQTEWAMDVLYTDHEFIPTFGLEILEGRAFSQDILSDQKEAFLLNETAMRLLGWTSLADQKFRSRNSGGIVGVVKDFHESI